MRLLFILVWALNMAWPSPLLGQPISLSASIDLAAKHSHLLKSRNEKIHAASSAQQTAESRYYPHLSAELGHKQLFFPPYNYRQQFGAAKLDWWPGDWLQKTALSATKQVEVQQADKQQVRLDLVRRVSTLYLGILRGRQMLTLFEKRLKILETHRQVAEALWQGGIRTELDVLQTRVSINRLTEQKKVQESKTRNLNATLASLLGLPLEKVLQLQNISAHAIDIKLGLVRSRLMQNPFLKSLQLQTEMQQLRLREVQASKWPHLKLRGAYVVDRDPTAEGNYWRAGFSIQVPIFLRGEPRFRKQEIKARMQSLNWEKAQAQREIKIQQARIAQDLTRLRETYRLQQERLQITEQTLQIATANYQAGLITNLEYLGAQEENVSTQVTLNETRLAYVLRLIDHYILINQPEKIKRLQSVQ